VLVCSDGTSRRATSRETNDEVGLEASLM
jgi:hypothetical protein